jgi:excisionase family DNA binding protein
MVALSELLTAEAHPKLVTDEGLSAALPEPVVDLLREIVTALAADHPVTVWSHESTLRTQEAADLLGVSRPTLVRLLEQGEIAYEQPGRHRRVLLADVLAYRDRSRRTAPALAEGETG